HLDHVKTQAPYAILAMIVACTSGYIYISFLGSSWVTYPLGAGLLVAAIYLLGRPPETLERKSRVS
ncbi:MAG: hypothetical protein ACPGQS_07860, partial [Bradymonadia bacterium]